MSKYLSMYKSMHNNPKRFPGYSIKRHIPEIKELIGEHNCKTLLDYGCGKGYQYLARRYHEEWGGILPYCYDPAVLHLDTKPYGTFDGVICTDVLEHVPEEEIDGVLEDLFQYANKFLFVSIALYESNKTLPNGDNCHININTTDWWSNKIKAHETDKIEKITAAFCYKSNVIEYRVLKF